MGFISRPSGKWLIENIFKAEGPSNNMKDDSFNIEDSSGCALRFKRCAEVTAARRTSKNKTCFFIEKKHVLDLKQRSDLQEDGGITHSGCIEGK